MGKNNNKQTPRTNEQPQSQEYPTVDSVGYKERKAGLYSGITVGLAIMRLHGHDTAYRELVALCDLAELVRYAVLNDDLEYSGLIEYGYVKEKDVASIKSWFGVE